MNTTEFLDHLKDNHVELWLDGDQLQVRGPQHFLNEALRTDLRRRKGLIVEHMERKQAAEGLPLSSPQRSMLSIYQADETNVGYNVACAFRLNQPAQQEEMNRAFLALQRRHDSLRTTFNLTAAGAVAVPHEHSLAELELLLPTDGASEREILEGIIDKPFNLRRGPVCRLVLVRRAGTEDLLILGCHHIAADFWSMQILTRELAELYEAACAGRPAELPPIVKSYPAFQKEEAGYLASEKAEQAKKYWTAVLNGELPVLDIAGSTTAADSEGRIGETTHQRWATDRFQRITDAARAHEVSPFVYLLSVYYLLLWKYARSTDIVVGVPSTLRTITHGCENTVGHFVNTLPLRMQVLPEARFAEWVVAVNQALLAGVEYQAYPFPEIVRSLALPRSSSHLPVFQAMFNWTRSSGADAGTTQRVLGELLYWTGNGVRGSCCDLMLTVAQAEDGATGLWHRSGRIGLPAVEKSLMRSFDLLVDQVMSDPDIPLRQLQVWNDLEGPLQDAAASAPHAQAPALLHEAVRAQAQRTPGAPAVADGRRELTYRELDAASDRIAQTLVSQALVGTETIVGVLMSRKVEVLITHLAVLKAGGVVLPLDPRYPIGRIETTLANARAKILIHDAENSGLAGKSAVPKVSYESIEVASRDVVPSSILGAVHAGSQLAYIIYTSGSTGVPNGVALEHRNILNLFEHSRKFFDAEDLKAVLASSAICFDVSIYELFLGLTAGGKIVIVENALELPPNLEGVTFVNAVASVLDTMLLMQSLPKTVRVVTSTGEPLLRPLANRVYALPHVKRLLNQYAPAETCIYSLAAEVSREEDGRIALGKPIEGRMYVLDEWGHEVPSGIVGEIYLSNRGVSRGYLHNPALTASKWVPDPFAAVPGTRMYRSGDFGRLLPSGEVEFVSRRDSQIKLRGLRIELQEIDTALLRLPQIKRAAVKVQTGTMGPYLVAYIVTRSGQDVDPQSLKTQLSERLPYFMVPQFYCRLEEMPLNSNGKIDRKALPSHELAPPAKQAPQEREKAPADAQVFELVAAIWAAALDVESPLPEHDFFLLGGHSLCAASVVARVNQSFGLALDPTALFDSPVLADFVAKVAASSGLAPRIPVPASGEQDSSGAVSPMQRGMWLDAKQVDDSSLKSYNVGFAFDIRGEVDASRLAECLGRLSARHAALRTVFHFNAGRLLSEVRNDVDLELSVVEADADTSLAAAKAYLARPLSLQSGPLATARLFRHGPLHSTLVLKLHHLICDGRTFRILADELTRIYASGSREHLPAPAVSYQSFALGLEAWLKTEEADKQRAFWRETLSNAPRMLELAGATLRPESSFRCDEVTFQLPAALEKDLKDLARARGVTPYMLYHSAFALLLSRLSGQRELILGTPYSCRHHQSLEDVVGLFVNMLPVRVRIDNHESFNALLKRHRQNLLRSFANGTLPFESMSADSRSDSGIPLIQCTFAYEHIGKSTYEVEGARWTGQRVPEHSAKFDLSMQILERGSQTTGSIAFRIESFPREIMERLRDRWLLLLQSLATAPDAPLVSHDALTEPERNRLASVTGPDAKAPARCIHSRVEEAARRFPANIAVQDEKGSTSYAELVRRAQKMASALKRRGVRYGGRVGLNMEMRGDALVLMLAAWKLGAAFVPISVETPRQRVAYICEDARLDILVSEQGSDCTSCECVALDRLLADEDESGAEPWNDHASTIAYIIYTSGSTGRPKGVAVSHASLGGLIDWHVARYQAGPGTRASKIADFGFDASIWEIWPYLCSGGSLYVADAQTRRDPERLCEWLERKQIELCFVPTAIADALLPKASGRLAGLRSLLTGGDRLRFNDVSHLTFELVNHYGPTEGTVVATAGRVETGQSAPGIGTPIDNARVYVLDESLIPVADGVPGEIVLGGPCLAYGYFGKPALTAEAFVPDPFGASGERMYRTGDIARWRTESLEFIGRRDGQVKRSGYRVELAEIQNVVAGVPGVDACVIYVERASSGNDLLVAAIVPGRGTELRLLTQAVRKQLADRLPAYMWPAAYRFPTELPTTPQGKVDYRALAAVPSYRMEENETAPRTYIEQRLADLWKEWLDVPDVSTTSSFFELGGHSVLAMQIVAEIEQQFGVKLSISTFFENATIEKLSRAVLLADGKPRDARTLPTLHEDPDRRYEPFPLTDIQQTYLVGRSGVYALGDIATHGYSEADVAQLDLQRYEDVLNHLVCRHEMLRTLITPDHQQRILPSVPRYRVEFRDLTGCEPDASAGVLADIRREMLEQVKSGYEWPLFESRVTRLPDGKYRIHFLVDALIADGFSVQILSNELVCCYAGREDLLEPVEVSFRDYTLAIEALKRTDQYEQSKRYWLARVNTLPAAPELPVDPRRVTQARGQFRSRQKRFGADQWSAMKRKAAAHGLTPSALLLSAYASVIGSWSKSSRFTLNLTLFNRLPLHPQIDRVVGDFTSLTLLEIDCAQRDFLTFAQQVQQRFWQDLEHRHFSGIELLRERARTASDSPSFVMPVVFTCAVSNESSTVADAESAGADLHALDGEEVVLAQTSQVWLDHVAAEERGELRLSWQSIDALFEPGVVDSMFAAYIQLLEEIARDDPSLREISLSRVPRAQLLEREKANADLKNFPSVRLDELVARRVAEAPAAPAVIAGKLSLTYSQLWNASGALAAKLIEDGVGQGQCVAIVMHKGWEQIVACLAALRAGAAYVPIDRSLPPARQTVLLQSVQAKHALVQEGDRPAAEIEGLTVHAVGRDLLAAAPAADVRVDGSPADIAYVIFTSGSTGVPKGVIIDHAGAVNTILDVNEKFGVGESDRVLALSSLSFDLSVYDIFGVLAAGGTTVLPDEAGLRDPARWAAAIESSDVTIFNAVPALMQLLVEHLEERSLALPPSLRLVMLSGDWTPAALPDRIRGLAQGRDVQMVSLGGATEASIWSVYHRIQGETSGLRSIPYGRPLANQSLHVLHEDLSHCPDWVAGDLYIGGKGLAKGYWRDEERTASSFIAHPFNRGERLYRTGDKARYMEDGVIEFLGREDTQVKVQGHRIELGEIESRLSRHPAVTQAVACIQKDAQGNARLAAYVVPKVDSDFADTQKRIFRFRKPAIWRSDEHGFALKRSETVFVAEAAGASRGLDTDVLGEWLTCVAQYRPDDSVLPRYFYPSAGSLNPVQLYVVVREELGNGLKPGSYYYHPIDHDLRRVSGLESAADAAAPARSPVTTVLVGEMAAIEPIYKEAADDFCRLEAGYMQELMESHGAALGLGTTSRGAVDPQIWRTLLGLADSQRCLAVADWLAVEGPANAPRVQPPAQRLTLPGRQSFRRFDGDSASLRSLPRLLRWATGLRRGHELSVQALLFIKRDIAFLPKGFHSICSRGFAGTGNAMLEAHHFAGLNVPIFEAADVVLFLFAKDPAGRQKSAHEAGRLGQFLMSRAAESHIGWCPIGSVDFAPLARELGLPESWELVHCLAGGAVSERQLRSYDIAQESTATPADLPTELQEFLRRELPDYMVPRQLVCLDALPLSANGKVARDRLARLSQPVTPTTKRREAPRTSTEKKLGEIWKDLLGLGEIGIDQTFFELGGNSMLLIRAHSRVKDEFDAELAMVDLFNYVDIQSLAAYLDCKRQPQDELALLQHQAEKRRNALGRLRKPEKV